MTRRDPYQADLLSWAPSEPIVRFEPRAVQAASFDQRLCKAMALALKESQLDRSTIAARMGAFLGKEVTKAMLDAYVSPARDTHQISVTRFLALLHVTHDRRLLELLSEPFGWAVVDERHADAIAEVELAEKRDEIERQLQLRRMKRRGAR